MQSLFFYTKKKPELYKYIAPVLYNDVNNLTCLL